MMQYADIDTTAYCIHGKTASGKQTRFGQVANNFLPLGTRIRLHRPINGRYHFYVRDRIGRGSSLDIWMSSCDTARIYGRHRVSFVVSG